MADVLDTFTRRRLMAGIRDRDTKIEITVRKFLHREGFRFRLHGGDLPGTPDIVLPKYRSVVFVHGCFWHRHKEYRHSYMPKSNRDFWKRKFEQNVERDRRNTAELHARGWRVLTIWECEILRGEALPGLVAAIRGERDGRTC